MVAVMALYVWLWQSNDCGREKQQADQRKDGVGKSHARVWILFSLKLLESKGPASSAFEIICENRERSVTVELEVAGPKNETVSSNTMAKHQVYIEAMIRGSLSSDWMLFTERDDLISKK